MYHIFHVTKSQSYISTFFQLCLGETLDLNLISFSNIFPMALYTFGILLLDLISKMASMKEQKFEFEVPISVTTMIVSLSTAGIFMLLQGLQWLFSFHLENNDMFICFLPNTLKWIVVQKIIVHLANRHNELKKLRQLKKFREKRLRQHEASQFQRKLKTPAPTKQ